MSSVKPPNPLPPDHSVGHILLTLTCILTAFTIVTTVLRIWARHGRRALGWDDYAIIVCCILATVRTGIQILSVANGNGRHRWYLTPHQYQYVAFLTWLTQLFLFTNIALLKCSICMLILRIKNERVLRYCLTAMMVGLVLTNLWPIIILLAECDPVKKYWKPQTPGKCWPTKVRIYSIYLQVAYSVVTDLICALLPIVVLWNIKISTPTKFGVCGLMSLGLIATAVALVRASSLGTKTADLSYDYCIAAIWANTELHLGIIATNLALSRMIWSFLRGTGNSTTNNTPRYASGSNLSRAGYVKSSNNRSQYDKDGLGMDTRASVDNASQASQIPLDPIIKRTTSVHVRTAPVEGTEESKETLSNWKYTARPSPHDEIHPSQAI
ncbi:hypothetical protein T440DRAFT_129735 [Plenodomus tracheiphilus IPT5]|uniref:Rhodopsin domain-containing protein n=1 Tax=Plenodomus tracheiphilus IPT5 TaxID=1408161 RepID=A0A6A7B226_9PLEO|nr:hypothetical protein T440DRAFT_129735 [Plenodomus tracheiphilus IPT5]